MTESYQEQFMQLLPRGAAWTRELGSELRKVAVGAAPEFQRFSDAAAQLAERESIPTTAVELLPGWERFLGLLLDECAPLATTIEGRQKAVAARLFAQGNATEGSGVAFLTDLAAAHGYENIRIRRFKRPPFSCEGPCNAAVHSEDWVYRWDFEIRHGDDDAQVACEVERNALGHIEVSIAWPLLYLEEMTYTMAESTTSVHLVTGETATLVVDEIGELYLGV